METLWWNAINFIAGSRGPFHKPSKKGTNEEMCAIAVRLFPDGPPLPGAAWCVSQIIEVLYPAHFVSSPNMLSIYCVWYFGGVFTF